MKQRDGIGVEFVHVKAFEIGGKGDFGPVFVLLVLSNLGLAFRTHVVGEDLLVNLAALAASSFNDEFRRVDIGQFGTVSVSATSNFGFVVIVVGRSKELSKDEFGDVDLFSCVHFDWNSFSVVVDGDCLLGDVNVDLKNGHRLVANLEEKRRAQV